MQLRHIFQSKMYLWQSVTGFMYILLTLVQQILEPTALSQCSFFFLFSIPLFCVFLLFIYLFIYLFIFWHSVLQLRLATYGIRRLLEKNV